MKGVDTSVSSDGLRFDNLSFSVSVRQKSYQIRTRGFEKKSSFVISKNFNNRDWVYLLQRYWNGRECTGVERRLNRARICSIRTVTTLLWVDGTEYYSGWVKGMVLWRCHRYMSYLSIALLAGTNKPWGYQCVYNAACWITSEISVIGILWLW